MKRPVVLAEADEFLAQRALTDRQLAFTTFPDKIYPNLFKPCRVDILMVTDSGGSFGMADFGLKALLDTLAVSPGPWVQFAVAKANRRADPTADIQNFRFDTTPLEDYDEIWMFGIERGFGGLSEAELRSISEFMNGGGGVFATGDHEDLGLGMCGRVPRVRSMRKWYWPNPGPNGEPVAPEVDGLDRFDTLREGVESGFQFDDQSDDVPQYISPKMYPVWPYISPFFRIKEYPHPLLCGPKGVIRVLPDHAHEGECYVPNDLTASFTFDGYTIEEYPTLPSGNRLKPEVIAWSHVIGGRTESDVKGPVNPRTFGAISSYDGHRVDVGRVVCDATWHHFFNINLIGDSSSSNPIKSQGFSATAAGQAVLENIKSYFRNIAVWLAREKNLACMRWRALWMLRWHHQIVIELRPALVRQGLESIDLKELVRIGSTARDVLGRVASQCIAHRWLLDPLKLAHPRLYQEIEPLVDPHGPIPPEPDPDPLSKLAIHTHVLKLLEATLGATLYAIAERFPEAGDDDARKEAENTSFEDFARRGLEIALPRALESIERSQNSLGRWAETVRSGLSSY